MFGLTKINSISTKELEEKLKINRKMQVIDVREPSEFASGHISGARNIPLGTIASFTSPLPIYLICQSGMRSKRAAKALTKKGLEVTNVSGGMSAWSGKTVR